MKFVFLHQILRSYVFQTLLFALLLCSFHVKIFAQTPLPDVKLSLQISDATIDTVLDSIAAQTNYFFTYKSDLLSKSKKINLNVNNEMLGVVLRKIIPDTSISFQLVNRHIIIVPAQYKFEKPVASDVIPYLSYRKISGIITSLSDHEALPYASIGIRGKHVGTISNQDGEFSLTISSEHQKDTLVVSYVGYKNTELPIAQIKGEEVKIQLSEDFVSLQEVIIRTNDPLSLIKAAIHKIPENYFQKPINLTSFYRESVLKSNKYMIYLESVLDIYKQAYKGTAAFDRVKVFKSRKIYDKSRLDTISFRLKGGIQGCLFLDIVKHHPEFLKEEYFSLYNYRLSDISTFNNSTVYIVDFKPKPDVNIPLLNGKLFIETQNLAIVRAEFGYEKNRLNELKDRFIAKGSAKTKVRPLEVRYVVSYRKINSQYFLNHTRGNLEFKVKNRKRLFSRNFHTSFEMATTQIDTVNIRKFKHRETIQTSSVFSTQSLVYDPQFWGNQNFIIPEENIQEALKRINNSMQQVAIESGVEE